MNNNIKLSELTKINMKKVKKLKYEKKRINPGSVAI